MPATTDRQSEIRRVQTTLIKTGFPRLKMLLIVSLTGGAGFLASYLMLQWQLTSMAWRYPASVVFAYLVFLFLLWLWLRSSAEDYTDIPDFSGSPGSHGSSAGCHSEIASPDEVASIDDGGALSEVVGGVAQAEEFAIPIFAILAVIAIAFSSLWIVYSAPTLFAELLIDGVLSATLYRRLRGIETHHWLETAIRRTVVPFAVTAIVVSIGGMAMHHYHPTATSLGEVIHGKHVDN